ncbi:MAG: polyprenyl synthetase family protein, partial [Chloroflexota bacterium]
MTVARYHRATTRHIVNLAARLFPHIPERFLEGKHLRGVLLSLVSDSLGGSQQKALPLAVAMDLVHQSTLEHDNVLDGHMERRGKPTSFALEGPGKAILGGDWLLALA